jgi:hypothetical protein
MASTLGNAHALIDALELTTDTHIVVVTDLHTVKVIKLEVDPAEPQFCYTLFTQRCFILDIVTRDWSLQNTFIPNESTLTPKERSFMAQKWGDQGFKYFEPHDFREVDTIFAIKFT